MRTMLLPAAVVTLALGAGALHAHHSGYMYQTEPEWISGVVVAFERTDPHTIIRLEERHEDGAIRRWAVEGPARSQLARRDVRLPQTGDLLDVCVFPYKSPEELARIFPELANRRSAEPSADAPQFVAGHVLVHADGTKQFWEPHGTLSACIRSSNYDGQSWIDLLRSNAGARERWCEQTAYEHVRTSAELLQVIAEIDALRGETC